MKKENNAITFETWEEALEINYALWMFNQSEQLHLPSINLMEEMTSEIMVTLHPTAKGGNYYEQ